MNISSASKAAAFQDAAAQKSLKQTRQSKQEASQQTTETAQAVKVRNRRAVQQAAAAPEGGNRISQDIRQITAKENRRAVEANRSDNLRRIADQMAVKFREMARRSEPARSVGNSEREGFAAVA